MSFPVVGAFSNNLYHPCKVLAEEILLLVKAVEPLISDGASPESARL